MSKTNGREKGSAMVIAVLVMAIMSLLGISYLLMADTENKIAENEKLSAQALYFGEGTIREVKRWFDRPPYLASGAKNLVQPTTAVMDRTHRIIDLDGAGTADTGTAADGTALHPYYKVGIDRDGDGNDDIFDKPYRAALADMLVGTEDGPDILIARSANTATATFLDGLRDKIAPSFPSAAGGVLAQIAEIKVYEPPYLSIAGTWTRYGMATVKVTVNIVKTAPSVQIISTRIVKAVLNETPFPGPFGPLQSCNELAFNGNFFPHWGTSTAQTDLNIGNGADNKIPLSLPRVIPPAAKIDTLYGYDNTATWNAMYHTGGSMIGQQIDDPWYRFIIDGTCAQWVPTTSQQPYPPAALPATQDKSNKIQSYGGVGCPTFDYATWKTIAQAGNSDTHYFSWDNGIQYRENGVGAPTDWRVLTDAKQGLFFFDTTDGTAPHDIDPATNLAANLTPEMKVSANYGMQGFLYANTLLFTATGNAGRPATIHFPNEPYRDANANGQYDPGEDWVNLNYNAVVLADDPAFKPSVTAGDAPGALNDAWPLPNGGANAPVYNARGPVLPTQRNAVIWGLLYTAGDFDSQGTPLIYGSVVTYAGTNGLMSGTPDIYWDTDLRDSWPPPGWDLPRVIITRWQTDL
ncbi:MAG TPA: pilus assembly PilX N-terminal domain-containing protein [Candidatus Polarisedimenticolaceae bacterium]|nr:pilus assembly PilX N-terminal domain-containing protein [Candidatus Polarisedimenticolaceae bacterium]